jgi:hypothetical protein
VTLAPLNLCVETLDGIRNHSWSRPAPSTPRASRARQNTRPGRPVETTCASPGCESFTITTSALSFACFNIFVKNRLIFYN